MSAARVNALHWMDILDMAGTGLMAQDDTSALEIEVTEEMIEAGVYAIRELPIGGKLEEIVRAAYIAMSVEASLR